MSIVHLLRFVLSMKFTRVHSSEVDSTGGAVDRRAIGVSLMATGAVGSSVWSLGSTIHTLVSAPVTSLATLALSGTAAGTGAYMYLKDRQAFEGAPTVNAEAVPA